MAEPIVVAGVWRKQVHLPATGFQVGEVISPTTNTPSLPVVCTYPYALDGQTVTIKGFIKEDQRWGTQIKAIDISVSEGPLTRARAILFSGMIAGVGPGLAERIIARWKNDDPLSHMTRADLLSVTGIGPKNVETILESWQRVQNRIALIEFGLTHGLTTNQVMRLADRYGADMIQVVTANPYILLSFPHIGWGTVENVAERLGIGKADPRRLRGAAVVVLRQAAQDGNTFLPQTKYMYEMRKLLDNGTRCEANAIFAAMREDDGNVFWLADDNSSMALMRYHDAEAGVAAEFAKLHRATQAWRGEILQDAYWHTLNDDQKAGVAQAMQHPVSILTGGAGVGKTQTIKAIVASAQSNGMAIQLLAPTGKAASRMAEVVGLEASTIHRLLGFQADEDESTPEDKRWSYSPRSMWIVDESSMIDIILAWRLLRAIPIGAHVIFVGDGYQLPSVGPGQFFRDLISSRAYPVTALTKNYRQREGSGLALETNKLRQRSFPRPALVLEGWDDISFLPKADEDKIAAAIELYMELQARHPIGDLIVLAALRAEVAQINAELQRRVQVESQMHQITRELKLAIGDPVRQTRNNYDLRIFNGETGIVLEIHPNAGTYETAVIVRYGEREVHYTRVDADDLTLAYCCTVHSSQGSEWRQVIAVVPWSQNTWTQGNFLTVELFYTQITRAREKLYLVGPVNAIQFYSTSATAFGERQTNLRTLCQAFN